MPVGAQIWNDAGLLIVDTTTWVPKESIAPINIGANPGSQSISVPAGTTIQPILNVQGANYAPVVTVNGSTVSWQKPSGAQSAAGQLRFMVY